ncbi:MAG: hypothetical protein IJT27_02065 [Clostridia bacterium]|nr:hypothetical protein [Clostridia bacterium]
MTSFFALSAFTRACFSLCALTECLACIYGIVLSAVQKRYRFAACTLVPFACAYFLWQVIFDIHLFGQTEKASAVSRKLGALAWPWWLAAIVLLGLAAAWSLFRVLRREKRSVTPTAVKLCLDRMPCGVCCLYDDGSVLFSNVCMNGLCAAITGSPLPDGDRLFSAANGVLAVEDRVWRFTRRKILLNGEPLYELIASDITAEYAETQALEHEKTELSRLNRELKEYTVGIDDTVRRQEILQAKVNIHDEMNRLMLSTMAAGSEDPAAPDRIFSLWEQNALLLCLNADETAAPKDRLEKLAETLKIRLIQNGEPPAALSERQQNLFFSAAQEALANAAKHAGAKTMEIAFRETDTQIICSFSNDGLLPAGEVRPTGGLMNLSLLAKEQGADIAVSIGERFTLCVRFPKNGENPSDG